jgi:hypothetical protein
MAALNFPDPNVQTSYTNPDTGITYEWANGIWKSVRTAQTAPELFVDAAGDNLTGNLTLGTDKIVLNATTGAATFSSTVDATAFTINGIPIGGSSSQTIISDTMPTVSNYNAGTLWWNSDDSDTSLYVLYQDPTGPNGDAGGKYWIEASPAPDSIGFDGTHTGDSTFTGNMNVTGTVDAGSINSGSITAQNTILSNRTGSTQTAFQATLSGVTKVNITAGGAATFGNTSGGASGTGGMEFTATNGQLDLVNTNSGSLITGYNRNTTSQVFSVGADGSASFASNIGIGGTTTGNFGAIDKGVLITGSDPQVGLRVHTSNGSAGILEIYAENGGSMFDTRGSEHIRFGSAATEFLRIDSSGNLLVGGSSSSNLIRLGQKFAVSTTSSYGGGSFTGFNGTRAAEGPIIDIQRSRGTTTVGTAVAANDRLGSFVFRGDNGTDFVDAAYMLGEVDGTPSGGFVPGRFTFYTGTGFAAPTEKVRIDSAGRLGIGDNDPNFTLDVNGNIARWACCPWMAISG